MDHTEERIKQENDRLLSIFSKLSESELETVRPLIQNASFLSVTLERLQDSINTGDVTEEYQNGAGQSGRKCSSELQTYNNLIKDYTSIMSKLLRLLPKEEAKTRTKFEKFLSDFESSFDE